MLTLDQAIAIAGPVPFGKAAVLRKTAADSEGTYSYTSREATYISYIQGIVKGASDSEMANALVHSKLWEIEPYCLAAAEKIKIASTPVKLPAEAYALCEQVGDKVITKYAAYDRDSTVEASVAFYDHREGYPYAWRTKTATALLARAQKYEANLPAYIDTYLHKAAGFGVPTAESLADALIDRERHVQNQEVLQKLSEAIQELQDEPALRYDFDMVKQAVALLDQVDAEFCMQRFGVPLAEEMLVSIEPELAKMAGCSNVFVKLSNGKAIDASALTKGDLEAVDPKLAAMSLDDLVDVLPTLPKPDADLLVRMA